MRVFIGFQEVAGYFGGLREGFAQLGVPVTFVQFRRHRYGYDTGDPAPFTAAIRRARERSDARGAGRWWWAWGVLLRVLQLAWALARFDVFVFAAGETYFAGRELPVYRLLRKKVVFVFLGSDERPPYLNGAVTGLDGPVDGAELARRARAVRRRVARADRWADLVVSHPPSSHFHDRPALQFLALGYPFPAPAGAAAHRDGNGVPRVLHAPSNRDSKGTAVVRRVLGDLKAAGVGLEYVELQDRPHGEVLTELARADLVVDEVWSDSPLGGLGVEAAWFGTPTVVGGYAWRLLAELGGEALPAAATSAPEAIGEAVRRLVEDAPARRTLGDQAMRFVRERWAPGAVAGRLLDALEGRGRPEWWFDPREMRYVQGYGMPEARGREVVAAVLSAVGRSGLCLAHNPEAEARLVEFAGEC